MAKRSRKKKSYRVYWQLSTLILVVASAILIYYWWQHRRSRFVKYEAFGIPIPENYSIHGIDVSKYQQTIAWDVVKEMKIKQIQLGFVFIKATEGIGKVDPEFYRNWKKSKQAGMIRGAYHFFNAAKDGREQAEKFIKTVELEKNDLPPVLDIEQLNGTSVAVLKKELKEWLDIVQNHYKVKPVIYTNVDFYSRYLGKDFDSYPLWAAHYYQYDEPRISRSWSFWQHSEEGRVSGILSKVDFNVFNGDSAAFRNLLIE